MKNLVIFDLDGTLLNTIADLGKATNVALAKCGFTTHPLDAYPNYVGNGVTKLVERALPKEYRTEEIVQKVRKCFVEYYNDHSAVDTKPYPGIAQMLMRLSGMGIKLAVASNKYQEAAEALVKHYFAGIPWVAIEGSKDGIPNKPDPSIVFEILSQSPTPKPEVMYVGDSAIDMETALRAGVEPVGVTWGFRPAAEIKAAGAYVLVDNPDDIIPLVMKDSLLED